MWRISRHILGAFLSAASLAAAQAAVAGDRVVGASPFRWMRQADWHGDSVHERHSSREGARHAQARQIRPIDEAASVPELAALRAQILRAVGARDLSALSEVFGPKVQIDFAEELTATEFVAAAQAWPEELKDTFWRDVHDAISLGMAHRGEGMFAPYTFVALGAFSGELSEDSAAISGRGVAVRTAPNQHAAVVESLTYEAVEVVPGTFTENEATTIDGFRYGWRQVVTPTGRTGWVSEKYLRSMYDMRLWFKQIDGQWRLVAIATGD